MNQNARKRKRYGSHKGQKHVSFNLVDEKMHSSRQIIMAKLHEKKFILMTVLVVVAFTIYVLWPAPTFSRHVQFWHDSGYIFKYQQYDIFYQDIRYLESPVKSSPVLLILHGFPTSSYDWKNLVPNLQKRFARIIIPDMLGLGFSDKPTGHAYSIKEQATIQEELLHSLNVTDVHILAHDYGDTVAQEILARINDPEYRQTFRVKSVCLTNGGIIPSQHRPRPIQKLFMLPMLKPIVVYLTNWFVFKTRFSTIFGSKTQPSNQDLRDFYSILVFKKGYLTLPEVLRYIPERHANEKRWVGALQETRIPLHLIYGPLDPVNTPDGFLETYKQMVPQSSITVLEDIGHYPQLEDEAGFKKSYNRFLDRIEETSNVL